MRRVQRGIGLSYRLAGLKMTPSFGARRTLPSALSPARPERVESRIVQPPSSKGIVHSELPKLSRMRKTSPPRTRSKAKTSAAGKRSSLAKGALPSGQEKKADEKSTAGTPKPEPPNQPVSTTDGANDESATDASKPRRATRKSVRISEV